VDNPARPGSSQRGPRRLATWAVVALAVCAAVLGGSLGGGVLAAEPAAALGDAVGNGAGERVQDPRRLDGLFAALEGAASEDDARDIEAQIWQVWLRAPDQVTRLLVVEAIAAREAADLDRALEVLDLAVKVAPSYPEVWNMRAFVHFEKGDLERSLSDIDKAIGLEPRHFAAMAGRARILLRKGQADGAQAALLAAVAVNPWLPERFLLADPPEPGAPALAPLLPLGTPRAVRP